MIYQTTFKKKNKILRNFFYLNIHEINSDITKLTFFYKRNQQTFFNSLVEIATFLELTTGQRSFFIRAKKSLTTLKIRRGAPIGAKVTLRKARLSSFLFKLVWLVLPNIRNFSLKTNLAKINHNKINSLTLRIPSALNFSELEPLYFFFKSYTDLKILLSFSKYSSKNELYFISRFYKIPI